MNSFSSIFSRGRIKIMAAVLGGICSSFIFAADKNDSFLFAEAGDCDFGIASKTGVLRYYRHDKKKPLIEYMTLGEGKVKQVEYIGAKWRYNWKDGKVKVKKGREEKVSKKTDEMSSVARSVLPVDLLYPENGSIELLVSGKLLSEWNESVTFKNEKTKNIFEIKCSRKESGGSASFHLKFMRWVDEDEVKFYLESKDGKISLLKPGEKQKASKVVIPFPQEGRLVKIILPDSASVSISKAQPFAGGRLLSFDMGKCKDFSLTVEDISNCVSRKAGNLQVKANSDNASSFIEAGGMPLMFVEAFEGKVCQSETGAGNGFVWSIEEAKNKLKASGRIESDWQAAISTGNDEVKYSFSGSDSKNSGLIVKFPYWIIGCPFEAELPSGEKISFVKGIPLRLGIDMELGAFPAGTVFHIWLTNTEKLSLKTLSKFALRSFRKNMRLYMDAFDSSFNGEFFKKVEEKGSAHNFPPGGWILKADRGEQNLSLKVSYKQEFRSGPEASDAAKVKYSDKGVLLDVSPEKAVAASPFWRVVHDAKNGGGISEITFRNGRGVNILAAPEEIYAISGNDKFSNIHDKNPEIMQEGKTVIVKGVLSSKDGSKSPIKYVSCYDYNDGYIKRKTIVYSAEKIKLNKLGILKYDLKPFLDECEYKPVVVAFRKAVFPGPEVSRSHYFGYGVLSVYRTGGEGIDFIPGSKSPQWTSQISSDKKSRLWGVSGNSKGGASIIIEPYSNSTKAVDFSGSACFEYYVGLPEIKATVGKRYFPARFQHWYFKNKNWLDDSIINKVAESGVNIVLDGNYGSNWVGQEVPQNPSPAKKKALEVQKERIKKWHKNSIKVVPFIGKGLIRDKYPAYKRRMLWAQMNKDLEVAPTLWNAVMMCHNAKGFNSFYQDFLMKWKKCLDLDGFYFDFVYPQGPCFNLDHYNCEHSDVDGLMMFMEWARENNEVIYGHTGYFPTIMCENLVDLTWVGEEINYWYSTDGKLPGLNLMRQYFCHIDNTQRIIDPLVLARWRTLPHEPLKAYLRYPDEDADEFACRMVLCGLFSTANMQAASPLSKEDVITRLKPWLDMFRVFKDVDFTKLKFLDWKNQNIATTGNPAVKASVYWGKNKSYIAIGNSESNRTENYNLKLNFRQMGWGAEKGSLKLRELPGDKIIKTSFREMKKNGLKGALKKFEYRVFEVEK